MKVDEIRATAKEMGIKVTRMKKADLIRSIQIAEGNNDCYGKTVDTDCGQTACLWREDCIPSAE